MRIFSELYDYNFNNKNKKNEFPLLLNNLFPKGPLWFFNLSVSKKENNSEKLTPYIHIHIFHYTKTLELHGKIHNLLLNRVKSLMVFALYLKISVQISKIKIKII